MSEVPECSRPRRRHVPKPAAHVPELLGLRFYDDDRRRACAQSGECHRPAEGSGCSLTASDSLILLRPLRSSLGRQRIQLAVSGFSRSCCTALPPQDINDPAARECGHRLLTRPRACRLSRWDRYLTEQRRRVPEVHPLEASLLLAEGWAT